MSAFIHTMRLRAAHAGKQVRSNIIYGFFVLLPMAVTVFIIVKLFHWMDGWINLVIPKSAHINIVPGMGVIALLGGTYALGLFARNYFGGRLLDFGNAVIKRIPLINKIYGILKQVVDAIASPKKKVLDKVVLIEFPHKGSFCLGFVTSRENAAISKAAGSDMISVFLPKAPSPASGFLFYLPASKVIEVDISMETALKLIMSAGVVTPDQKEAPARSMRLQDVPALLRIFKPRKKEFLDPRD